MVCRRVYLEFDVRYMCIIAALLASVCLRSFRIVNGCPGRIMVHTLEGVDIFCAIVCIVLLMCRPFCGVSRIGIAAAGLLMGASWALYGIWEKYERWSCVVQFLAHSILVTTMAYCSIDARFFGTAKSRISGGQH